MCYYCSNGLPPEIQAIYDRYLPIAGESAMHFGPAHIVWEDFNLGRDNVQWCLDNFEKYQDTERHSLEELAAVRASLDALLLLDLESFESQRDDNH